MGVDILNTQREQLDRKMEFLRESGLLNIESGNWIRNIRHILGMKLHHLADLMGIYKGGVNRLEKREAAGAITIYSLRKVADKMDCDLVYAFVPRTSFNTLLKKKAYEKAERMIDAVTATMALEDQPISDEERSAQIKDLAEGLIRNTDKRIWDEY
jgi:predicted DNA-binding mobile mystery protein A